MAWHHRKRLVHNDWHSPGRRARFDDANKRCKVLNQPIRLSALFLSTQRFTTRSTQPSTRNASSDARHKAGHDDENYEQAKLLFSLL
jgi:hypothetical protein